MSLQSSSHGELFQSAPDNPYILDILLRILVNLPAQRQKSSEAEISELFERLRQVGEESGHSFYVTRRAEYEYRLGKLSDACKLIDEAAIKTPGIFQVRLLRAHIYLDAGNKTIAADELKKMRDMVFKSSGGDRLSNLRPLLELEAAYNLANGNYSAAKEIFARKGGVFSAAEREKFIKDIETEQAYGRR